PECDPAVDVTRCLPLDYRIHTVYRAPDGTLVPTDVETGKVGLPEFVDVNHDSLPDLLVQLQIDAGRATVRTSTLAAAPSPLPLSVETVLVDPRGGSDLRAAFGYDALTDTAPSAYDATLTLLGSGRVTSFGLDVHTVAPGSTLAVTAGVFDEGPSRERIDPQTGRVSFTPVPAVGHFDVLVGEDVGVGQSGINVVTDTPTKAVIEVVSQQGDDVVRGDITLDKIPNSASITYSNLTTGQANLSYNATDRIDVIDVRAASYDAGVLKKDFQLRFEDMPLQVTIVQDSPTHATAQATSAIGLIKVGIADNGVPVFNTTDPAYVLATDAPGYDSLAFQLHGLSAAELGSADPLVLGATLTPEPLHVQVKDGARQVEAWVKNMPSTFRIEASPSAGTVDYSGSSVIDELTVVASDPAGLAGKATNLNLLLRSIPTALALGYAPVSGAVSLDAGGSTLGLIEVQLTNGPNKRIDPARDGIRLDDTAAGYEMFGRVTGLRKVVARTAPSPDLDLQTAGGRVFQVELNQLAGAKVEYTRATLNVLPAAVRLQVTGQNIAYSASSTASTLVFDTNSGDRWNLGASIANPVPTSFTVCQASDISCTPAADRSGRTQARVGSVRFVASEHTTLNLLDCVRPLNATCPGNPSEFVRVSNLWVRVMGQDADASSIGDSGHIFVDTDNHELRGNIVIRSANNSGFEENFGGGFRSQNRLGKWSFYGLSNPKSGTISCTSGTALKVRFLGLDIGVTGFLC
ncbi:MAG TPA: hypothetical protein VNB24_06745, partial [Acidimicrobiales bacterium]|nr:hypothetical protein [Acidimicrobiales bacterium]